MDVLIQVLVLFGSISSIGFGIWHFFVPKIWNWYSYVNSSATELILAVRAINVFFSISLVLFGLICSVLIIGNKSNTYSQIVVIGATCVLWLSRVLMQIIYPQGSASHTLQFGMLIAFIIIFLCYTVSLGSIIWERIG